MMTVRTIGYRAKHKRHGAVIPLLAILLPVVIILAAFAINIAYLELNRTEMYIASDAASRAACREMAITSSTSAAMVKGRDAASRNLVSGKPLLLANSDFAFGHSTRPSLSDRYNFAPSGTSFNSVEVTARKQSSSANGPIEFPIPTIFSISSVNASQTSRANQTEVDISLVLDRSGSMAYADFEPAVFPPVPSSAPPGWSFGDPAPNPSRWRDAVDSVNVFLNELEISPSDELVSLSTYNNTTAIDHLPTNNYDVTRDRMNNYTENFQAGATNIGGGILAGRDAILSSSGRKFATKVMIVLTDGIDTVGSDPIGAAEACMDDQIMIFTITFSNEADQTTMANVAAIGLGRHYHASTGANLQDVFRDIARQLPILISR